MLLVILLTGQLPFFPAFLFEDKALVLSAYPGFFFTAKQPSKMPPKKNSQKDRHKRIKITLELKREIIENRERGMSVAALVRRYNRSSSTICTILKNKDKIKEREASKGVTRISMNRLQVLDDVEKLLLVWINEKQSQGDDVINESIICDKAKKIFADLVDKRPSASTPGKDFKASRGWFEKFKRRTGIHKGVRNGEGIIETTKAANNFVDKFKKCLEDYLPQQVFGCNDTDLLWRKMPNTYIITEALPDLEASEDRLTLLLCANASGDLKIKPLLVNHSNTTQAFGKCNVQKNKPNVMWRSNSKAEVTRDLLVEWVNKVFGPSVEKYLLEMNLPLQALLVMNSSPANFPDLQDDLPEEFKFVKIQFLPPETSALFQPMNQTVISSFKKLYTKAIFERCFENPGGSNLTVREFWKDHFHIVTGLELIEKAWEGVAKRILMSVWKKLWPEIAVEANVEMKLEPAEHEVDEILPLAKTVGPEVDDHDTEEIVEGRSEELTTEELMELYRVSQQKAAKESSAMEEEEEEGRAKQQSCSSIIKMLSAWERVASFIEKHHPDKAEALQAISSFSENALSPFLQILKRRQKQMTRRPPNKKN